MDIITHPGEVCNLITGEISPLADKFLSAMDKWMEKKNLSGKMADRMDKIGEHGRAFRMRNCADMVSLSYCPECGTRHVRHANLCRDRFCPICAWRLSMRRFGMMCNVVGDLTERFPDAVWQFVTLTVKNCAPDDLSATIDDMSAAWNKIFMRRSTKSRPILGWARSLEITYNAKTHTVHPHFHILVIYKAGYGDSDWLVSAWLNTVKRTAEPVAQNFQTIHPRSDSAEVISGTMAAVLETYKYSVKSSDLFTMPLREFRSVDEQIKGKRMQSFGGVIKEIARLHDDTEEISSCPKCGNIDLINIVGKWCGDGYVWRRE